MALGGIDTRIAMTKTAEFAAEQAKLQRQNEVASEHAARLARRQIERDGARLQAAAKAKGARISSDTQKGGNASDGPYPQKKKKQPTPEPTNTIDIVV
ncbi:MAG: hypothetical protein FWE59_05365 [Oscillospiraceae bacterium]|nr:hypothetical protein [Oscillospiraceae bacterium]